MTDHRHTVIAQQAADWKMHNARRWTLRWILFPSFRRYTREAMEWSEAQIDKWLCDLRTSPA